MSRYLTDNTELKCVDRPITLKPKEVINSNETLCPTCGGIGFMLQDDKWLVPCKNCNNGIVPKCKYCGEPMLLNKPNGYTYKCSNPNCDYDKLEAIEYKNKQDENELNRFNKAIQYTFDNVPKDSIEFMYSDSYGYNEGFFNEIEELEDYCYDEDIAMPKYVWCTKPIRFSLDGWDLVERALEDSYEDASDNVDGDELKELQNACDKFCKNHKGFLDSYDIDYRKCVLL